MLTTRYFGLRRLFLEHIQTKKTGDICEPWVISQLWNLGDGCTQEWKFTLDFAAFCVSTDDTAAIVEKHRPHELGRLNGQDRSVIETLLASALE